MMPVQSDFDAGDFADRLAVMSEDELFETMQGLEKESEDFAPEERDSSDVFAKIALVETAIEDRFPGQLLAPYKDWQQRRTAR
jgi:methionyl-tRNA formyltransferase